MKQRTIIALLIAGSLVVFSATVARAADSEIEELKAQIKALTERVIQLEKEKAAAPAPVVTTNVVVETVVAPATNTIVGHASPIADRGNLNDQQAAAQRPNDLTLDPKYRGYIPVPNTPALIKFNAKPRVDVTSDTKNSGDPDRFVTAKIPVVGQTSNGGYGGPEQFNINARGSQLSLDVRAPEMPGNFRFYYQNDFFGSGSGMQYRLRQLYGEFYNVTAGFTYSVFEDPDAWPDTVDYEGPNSAIFARRAVVRYMIPFADYWQLNIGLEQPGAEVNGGTNEINQVNSAPDGGFNIRWEDSRRGHVQFGAIFRDIGASGAGLDNQSVFGWGLNLSSSINVFEKDSIQEQLTYGHGLFRYCNDDFQNNDAAFDNSGNLEALPWFGAMVGYTHHWSDMWRSTATFGFNNISNELSEGPDAYHETYYASANLVCQLREHLSVGLEGLFGQREVQSGDSGNVWRFQLGMVYQLFD
jgi:hypothetical protein